MATNTPVNIGTLIESTPGVVGGRPRLAGTRIRVSNVVIRHAAGMTPEQIVEDYPHLDLPRVYAALAYYHANKVMIDAEVEEEERLAKELEARFPNGWTREADPTLGR